MRSAAMKAATKRQQSSQAPAQDALPCFASPFCGPALPSAPPPAGFPVPRFSPGFMALKADTVSGTLSVAAHCSLWYPGPSGERVATTGLPNWQAGPYLPGQGDNVPCKLAMGGAVLRATTGQARCMKGMRRCLGIHAC